MDLEQLNKLIDENYPRMWLIAAGISGDQNLAEDIVQDAALVVAQRRSSFEPGTNFGAWMARIVRLTALNYSRKFSRQKTYSADPDQLNHVIASPGGNGQWKTAKEAAAYQDPIDNNQLDFDDQVLQALKALSDEARACLLLRTVEDLSYREISDLLDMSENTAMSHVHRAKQRMRKRLGEQNQPEQIDTMTKPIE